MKKSKLKTVKLVIVSVTLALMFMLLAASTAKGKTVTRPNWKPVTATWYGPGYYGNTTACGIKYTIRTKGIAHPTLPCGTRVSVKYNGRVARVKVVDSCPACFDLTARTAMDLCACTKPRTIKVVWTHGWFYRLAPRPAPEVH